MISLSKLKNLEPNDRYELHSKISEITSNALTHSESKEGITCHGYFNNKNTFTFSVYDLGIGIPESVRRYLKNNIDSKNALEWALKSGNTTRNTDYPRGIGFPVLEEYSRSLKGKITIITEDILYTNKKGKSNFTKLNKNVKGTLFTLKISV